jgi:hypothetical protein
MISAQQLDALDPQTRQAVQSLLAQVQQRDAEIAFKQALIDKLTHENAILKRLKFAATSERFASTLASEQRSLLEETLDTGLAELDRELERERGAVGDKDKTEKKQPKRAPLPPHLPRRDVVHEPADTTCGCGQPMQRIGEDVAEKLDYQPAISRACSPSSAMCAASGRAGAARRWCRPPCRHTSSTRASPQPACWPRCWWRSSSTTCRCTGRRRSSSAPGT